MEQMYILLQRILGWNRVFWDVRVTARQWSCILPIRTFFGGVQLGKISLTVPLISTVVIYEQTGEKKGYAFRFAEQKVRLAKGEVG